MNLLFFYVCKFFFIRNYIIHYSIFFFFKDLTELAGNDDCEISYCSSSFINTIIDTNFLKNETPSSIVKQEFFVESLDEWKTLIKDQQDYIRIVVISRYVNIYACSFE